MDEFQEVSQACSGVGATTERAGLHEIIGVTKSSLKSGRKLTDIGGGLPAYPGECFETAADEETWYWESWVEINPKA